jgi:methoxymalonate biosynthesis acyl carrier protein
MATDRDAVKQKTSEFLDQSLRYQFEDDEDIFEAAFVNSLFAMQLVQFVESAFGIMVESEDLDLANFRTIEKIADLVAKKSTVATNNHGS